MGEYRRPENLRACTMGDEEEVGGPSAEAATTPLGYVAFSPEKSTENNLYVTDL